MSSGKKTLTGKKSLTERADRTSSLTRIFTHIIQKYSFLNDLNHPFPEAKFIQKPEFGHSYLTRKGYKKFIYTLMKVSKKEKCIKIEGGI